jgi:hypothetical protein
MLAVWNSDRISLALPLQYKSFYLMQHITSKLRTDEIYDFTWRTNYYTILWQTTRKVYDRLWYKPGLLRTQPAPARRFNLDEG